MAAPTADPRAKRPSLDLADLNLTRALQHLCSMAVTEDDGQRSGGARQYVQRSQQQQQQQQQHRRGNSIVDRTQVWVENFRSIPKWQPSATATEQDELSVKQMKEVELEEVRQEEYVKGVARRRRLWKAIQTANAAAAAAAASATTGDELTTLLQSLPSEHQKGGAHASVRAVTPLPPAPTSTTPAIPPAPMSVTELLQFLDQQDNTTIGRDNTSPHAHHVPLSTAMGFAPTSTSPSQPPPPSQPSYPSHPTLLTQPPSSVSPSSSSSPLSGSGIRRIRVVRPTSASSSSARARTPAARSACAGVSVSGCDGGASVAPTVTTATRRTSRGSSLGSHRSKPTHMPIVNTGSYYTFLARQLEAQDRRKQLAEPRWATGRRWTGEPTIPRPFSFDRPAPFIGPRLSLLPSSQLASAATSATATATTTSISKGNGNGNGQPSLEALYAAAGLGGPYSLSAPSETRIAFDSVRQALSNYSHGVGRGLTSVPSFASTSGGGGSGSGSLPRRRRTKSLPATAAAVMATAPGHFAAPPPPLVSQSTAATATAASTIARASPICVPDPNPASAAVQASRLIPRADDANTVSENAPPPGSDHATPTEQACSSGPVSNSATTSARMHTQQPASTSATAPSTQAPPPVPKSRYDSVMSMVTQSLFSGASGTPSLILHTGAGGGSSRSLSSVPSTRN